LSDYPIVHVSFPNIIMPTINTNITIAAPPSIVRQIILDFPSYPQWNPFITSATVSNPAAPPGTPIKIVISKFIKQNSTITQNDTQGLAWVAVIIGKWFFQADHHLIFEPVGDRVVETGEGGSCRVVQSEKLSGLLSALSFIYGPFMKSGFKKMNKALKVRAESLAAGR
jgi:hypothetical protein